MILDAAYRCFARHGVRRTTMEDIAAEAGMSRPAAYQYVRSKDDAFRLLAVRLFTAALDGARAASKEPGPLADRLERVLAIKLGLTQQIFQDSPHAAELLGENARISADIEATFKSDLAELVTDVISDADRLGEVALGDDDPREIAALALAFTRGLEADLGDERRPRERLRRGVTLLIAGLAAAAPADPS
jgi:TetR/AcrR family transcriptional regulator